MSKNRVDKRVVLKIYRYKMKKNKFELICLNMAYYRQYVDYYKVSTSKNSLKKKIGLKLKLLL